MATLLILGILVLLIVRYVRKSLTPSLRNNYLAFCLFIAILGVGTALIYTLDNLIMGQVGMSGDEQYYYEGAISYLETGMTKTFYPSYEKFLAAFLFIGNPLVARIAQVLLFFCIYALMVRSLDRFNVSKNGFIYFSVFTALNGIYYGTAVMLVRNILIIFSFSLMFAAFAWYYTRVKEYRRAPLFCLLAMFILNSLWLRSLGDWLIYPLVAGVIGELVLIGLRDKKHQRCAIIATAIVIMVLLGVGFQEKVSMFWQIHILEERPLAEEEAMLGGERSRSILDPFKMLLGPGLIRPLFPGEYFLVWIPSHAAFYWWGTLFWYVNLILSAPFVLKRPLAFLNKRGAIYPLLIFLSMTGIYTLAYISGVEMRKRAMFHFFYTLFVTVTYFTPADRKESGGLHTWRLPLSTHLLRFGVILAIMIATILSIERIP